MLKANIGDGYCAVLGCRVQFDNLRHAIGRQGFDAQGAGDMRQFVMAFSVGAKIVRTSLGFAVDDGFGNRFAGGGIENTAFEGRAARQHEVNGVVAARFNAQELNDAVYVLGVVWAQKDFVSARWDIRSRPVSAFTNKR